jgi:chromosome segregation ATPase
LTQTPNMSPGDAGQTPQPGDPPGQTPSPQSQTQSGQQNQQQRTSLDTLPLDAQDYIRSLRQEAKTYREQLEARQRREEEARQEQLKKQGEFQKLAEKHEQRVKELEPVSQRYTALADLLKGQIDTQVKDWPAEVKAFDPGADSPIEQRLAWVEKSRPLVEKLTATARGNAPGNSPNPPPANQGTSEQDVSELRRRIRESGKINF